MENPIKSIYKWQKDAGNLDRQYDDFLESSFQIEEALEGFIVTDDNGIVSPKRIARNFMTSWIDASSVKTVSDVDRLDKACDAIIFAIGSMGKLGLNAQQIQQALLIVNRHNTQKLGMPRDEHGKLTKPENFVGPELELQELLDKRKP